MTRLDVLELGPKAAPPIALLVGSPVPRSHLLPLAERLAKGFHVLLVDLPGHGDSPSLVEHTMTGTLDALEETLSPLATSGLGLVGLSSGGYRALALAVRGRLPVRAVVSLGGFASLPDDERRGVPGMCEVIRAGVDMADLFVARFLSPGFAAAHPDAVAEVRSWAVPRDEILVKELQALAASNDLRPHLGALQVPVVVRVGDLDVATPVDRSEDIAKRCGAKLEVVRDAGHLLPLEDLGGTADSVERAMAAHIGAGAPCLESAT